MWQPIETAVKDNRLVDLWCEYYDENGELYDAERRTDCHFVVVDDSWYDGQIKLGGGTDIRITHWMPRPDVPSKRPAMIERVSHHPLTWLALGLWLGWLSRGDIGQAFWHGLTQ